jgi:NAD(P)H-flavin reductase/ferredoxin
MSRPFNLLLDGQIYTSLPEETVLDTLLRHKVNVPFSCKKQTCMSCVLQSLNGPPPVHAQVNLKDTLQLQNNFLACSCIPERDMEIAVNQEILTRQVSAHVVELNWLNPTVLELVLQCETPVDYHGGQLVLLLNYEHIGKKFPIASATSAKSSGQLTIHVKRKIGAVFSAWIHENLRVDDQLFICGVSGELFYVPGHPKQPLLLTAWDGDLAAMIGVVQDVFEHNHNGPVYLFHSVASSEHLYFSAELNEISDFFPNFHYFPCVEHGPTTPQSYQGPVDIIIAKTLPNLSHWKIYLCGSRNQTHSVQKQAYLTGAAMKDIYVEVTSF